jgi:hypothetical protein
MGERAGDKEDQRREVKSSEEVKGDGEEEGGEDWSGLSLT